jgi:hypothetical protein
MNGQSWQKKMQTCAIITVRLTGVARLILRLMGIHLPDKNRVCLYGINARKESIYLGLKPCRQRIVSRPLQKNSHN